MSLLPDRYVTTEIPRILQCKVDTCLFCYTTYIKVHESDCHEISRVY